MAGDSNWAVSILIRERVVIAALASRVLDWTQPSALAEPRTWRFERAVSGSRERWEVSCEGTVVTERLLKGELASSKSKELGDRPSALAAMARRIDAKVRTGFVLASEPPARWELGLFEGGADSFPVDYATAAITLGRRPARLRPAQPRQRHLRHRLVRIGTRR